MLSSSRIPWAASPPAFVGGATQDALEDHRDQRAEDRADQVDPVVAEVAGDQHRGERPGRVHRRPGDRGRPHRHQADVAADGEGAVDPDVARSGGGAQDDADQAEGQERLGQHRHPETDSGARVRWRR